MCTAHRGCGRSPREGSAGQDQASSGRCPAASSHLGHRKPCPSGGGPSSAALTGVLGRAVDMPTPLLLLVQAQPSLPAPPPLWGAAPGDTHLTTARGRGEACKSPRPNLQKWRPCSVRTWSSVFTSRLANTERGAAQGPECAGGRGLLS